MVNKIQLFLSFQHFLTNFERFMHNTALCFCLCFEYMQNDIFLTSKK